MKIKNAYCAYEPEKFKQAFGFKGSTLSGVWQTVVLLQSETACGVGLGVQSVLWSDSRVFAAYDEKHSNEAMYRVTQYAVNLIAGQEYDTPYEMIRKIFDPCKAYAKESAGMEVTDTFVLNALVPVDLAAWQLWAKEKGIRDFDEIYKGNASMEKLVNIPLITYHTSVEEVKQLAETGISIFKIKLGADPNGDGDREKMLKWDQQRALELHRALKDLRTEDTESGRIVYYFDANGRYDTKERLRELVDFLEAEGIAEQTVLFEEPFAPENEIYVGDLPLCFAADESVHSLGDVEKRIALGYKAITLKPIAKTLSVTLEMAKRAQAAGVQCFCADLTVNPVMVEWNKCVASRLQPLKGMKVGVVESNGAQNYVNWEKMLTYLPQDGSVFTVPEHYARLVKEQNHLLEPIRFAIYGCGFIANVHAAAIKSLPQAQLVGAADLFAPAAQSFAQKHGIEAYEALDQMLQDHRIDAVCICTPNGTHADLAVRVLEHDKNVVLEKPMAISTEDCDRVIEAAKDSKGRLMVISQLRMSPDIKRARDIVRSGALGKLILCQLSMRYYRSPEYYKGSWKGTLAMDGGALLNQGVHGIDLLQYIAGPIKDVKGITRTLFHQIEAEDTAVAALEFENGALGTLEASTATHPGHDRQIHICGSRGFMDIRENCIERLVIDGKEQPCSWYQNTGMSGDPTRLEYADHANQLLSFIRALQGENEELVDEYEGKKAVQIIGRIYQSR